MQFADKKADPDIRVNDCLHLYLAALTFSTSFVISSYEMGMSFFAESNPLNRFFRVLNCRDIWQGLPFL